MSNSNAKFPELHVTYHEDPEVLKKAATDEYSTRMIPPAWKLNKWDVNWAWWAFITGMYYMIVGAQLAMTVGSKNAIIAIIITTIIFGIIGYILTQVAAKNGLNLDLFSRTVFGYVGEIIASILCGLTFLYYATFEASIIAHSFETLIGGPRIMWYAIISIVMIPLVWFGVSAWIAKFNKWSLPIYFILLFICVGIVYYKVGSYDGWLTYMPEEIPSYVKGPGWFWGITVYTGLLILFMGQFSYGRFLKKEDAKWSGHVTFGIVFYCLALVVNGLFGIWFFLSCNAETPDIGEFLPLVVGAYATIMIFITQFRINTGNLYASSISFSNLFKVIHFNRSRTFWLVVLGILVFFFMLTDVVSWLVQALQIQGVGVGSWLGTILAYLLFARKYNKDIEEPEIRRAYLRRINWDALTSFIVAFVIGITFFAVGNPWANQLCTISSVVSAFILYTILIYVTKAKYSSRLTLADIPDVRSEVDDPHEARVLCDNCNRSYIATEMTRVPAANYKPICSDCITTIKNGLSSCREKQIDYE